MRTLPKWLLIGLSCVVFGVMVLADSLGCLDPKRDLQTVVKVGAGTVLVRYRDGRKAYVLNDMNYDLEKDQNVKVVSNCDGHPHVVVAYAKR